MWSCNWQFKKKHFQTKTEKKKKKSEKNSGSSVKVFETGIFQIFIIIPVTESLSRNPNSVRYSVIVPTHYLWLKKHQWKSSKDFPGPVSCLSSASHCFGRCDIHLANNFVSFWTQSSLSQIIVATKTSCGIVFGVFCEKHNVSCGKENWKTAKKSNSKLMFWTLA